MLLLGLGWARAAQGQAVAVTLKLDASQIGIGETTTLHVYGQVLPASRAKADRIFSFYLDLLNSNGSAASLGTATKVSADHDPLTSGAGVLNGANLLGIYDTFLNLAHAGRDVPVELFAVPIRGVSQGTVTFQVRAGSGIPNLSEDFLVAPSSGIDPLLGGDYSQAAVDLSIGTGGCQSRLASPLTVQAGGAKQISLSFTTCPGKSHTVEFTDSLANPNWQPLSGGAPNSGTITDSAARPARFYRVRLQ
jgi:hypothetical protein